ncbi:MAG: orotate phosphoribosyltransferase [Gammaproteobacteria bacterium]|nr:orotate phosphoribosyltransferase [Gammaproteobacteria bacterium]
MNQAQTIAQLLLEIKAVGLSPNEPYRYTSGLLSPIYCDNRLIISYPDKRLIVLQAFLNLIESQNLQFDVVAGTATAGIPHAAWIADRLSKPMVYVRAKTKSHGKQNQIEGKLNKGQTALVVEDLISTGQSSIAAGVALRDAGANVTDCIAIFSYQIQTASQSFSDNQIKLHTLTDLNTLIDVAITQDAINESDKTHILSWAKDPGTWSEKHD